MSQKVLWQTAQDYVNYPEAIKDMDAYAYAIAQEEKPERVWLVEHPPLYTLGTSADKNDVLPQAQFPTFETGRGGQITYHGPGQRVAYVQLNLKKRTPDIKKYIFDLEEWLIQTLSQFGVKGERRPDRIGIWVHTPHGEKKIAAIGVRLKKWVTLHGIALNVDPDLSHFEDIIPCGIQDYGVTSLKELGVDVTMVDIDKALQRAFKNVFE
jgi:lipoyl(octanoyl) transferase